MKLLKEIYSEKFLVLADQVIFSGSSFVIMSLMARALGLDIFGVFSSILLAVYMLMSITNALVIQPMQIGLAKFENKNAYAGYTLLLLIATLLGILILSGLGYVTINLISWDISKYTTVFNNLNWATVAGVFALMLTHDYARKFFLATNSIKKTIVIDSILAGVMTTGIISLNYLNLLNLETAFQLYSLGYGLSVIAGLILIISKLEFSLNKEFRKYHRIEGTKLLAASVFQWWSGNIFVVASGLFLGASALGAFRLVQSIFGVLNILLQTFENYVIPTSARLHLESIQKSKDYLLSIGKKGAVLFAICLGILFVFAKPIIGLIGGPEFHEYAFIIRGMCILYCIIYLGYAVRIPIRIMELNNSFLIGYIISFAFSVISIKFLIENYGITGAIIGLIINQILMIAYWQKQLIKNDYLLWK